MNALILATLLLATPPTAPAAADVMAAPAAPAPDAMGMDAGWKPYDYANPPQKKDEIPASTWVIVAYLIIWALLLGYVVILAGRQARLRDELAALHRRLDAVAPPDGGAARERDA